MLKKIFNRFTHVKSNSKQIEQVADDVVIELGKMNPKFRPEEFERIWTTKMTTKDKENLIKKVLASPPPGISGSDWGAYVTDALKSSGTGLGKGIGRAMLFIWTKGLGIAGLYYGGSYLTGWYGDTKSVPGAIWNTVTWPYHFLKYMNMGGQHMYKTSNFEFFIGSDQLFQTISFAKGAINSDASAVKGSLSMGFYMGLSAKIGRLMEHPLNANRIPGIEQPKDSKNSFFRKLFGKK